MSDPENKSSDPKPAARRPYEAPRVEETGDFERLVLACSNLPDVPICEVTGNLGS
jgi:hypothetical protein